MKRILAAAVLIAMLIMPNAGAQINAEALYETLGNYILYYDLLLADELWAYDHIEAFYGDRTYDNLNIARAAVQSALREIRNMETPVYGISAGDSVEMMAAGIETDALVYMIEEIDVFIENRLIRLQDMFDFLIRNVYYEPALENRMERIGLYRQDVLMDAESTAHFINYLALQIGKYDDSEAFWNYIRENTTVIAEYMSVFMQDELMIAEAETDLLDKISECGAMITNNVAFDDVLCLLWDEAAETGDTSGFLNARTRIAGEYEIIPEAWWMTPETGEYLYLFSDPETGDIFVHTMGNEIIGAPDKVRITYTGITGTDAVDYLEFLIGCGFSPLYELVNEDGKNVLYVIVNKGNSAFTMIWSEEETIVYLSSPLVMTVPVLFFESQG